MQYRVTRRCRHERQKLSPGNIIESHINLAEAWPDRFEAVEAEAAAPEAPPNQEIKTADPRPPKRGRGRGRKVAVQGEANPPKPTTLRAIPKGGGLFDVINTVTNKTINSEPLSENEAKALVEAGADEGAAAGN
jgi:hypothetical protein